jgi:hypothetical protein
VAAAISVFTGESLVTDKKRKISGTSGKARVRRTWEPMSLTRVGTFGEVLRSSTGDMGDTGGGMHKG